MKILKWTILFTTCLFMTLASCGYRFEGGGYIKDDVSQVAVLMFENQTSQVGAGLSFTNALTEEIITKSDTRVVDQETALFILKGSVKSITFATLSRSTSESVIERRVTAVTDLKLVNRDGDVIWSVKDFKTNEEYEVSSDQVTDESNIKDAVDEIAERSAEKLISKMMVNF